MSTVITDNLTGKTSAGDVTITSEGGAATMQLQQGVAKAWINFNGTGTIAARDSLNLSGLTDNGTGDYIVGFTNNMNNSDYSAQVTGTLTDSGTTSASTPFTCRSLATSSMRATGAGGSNVTFDMIRMCVAIQGDLA